MPVIVHLSDIHFGAQLDELAESLVADIWDHPDLVVVSGDLTQRARRDQFTHARAFLDRLPAPVLTVMGNHDVPLFDLPRRLVSPTGRYRTFITPSLDPVFDVPDWLPSGWTRCRHGDGRPDMSPYAAGGSGARRLDGSSERGVAGPRHAPPRTPGKPLRTPAVGSTSSTRAAKPVWLCFFLGHTHTARVDVVTIGADGRHHALAVVAGTAVGPRTRGTANTYNVVKLMRPMEVGATVTVEIRQAKRWAGWPVEMWRSTTATLASSLVPGHEIGLLSSENTWRPRQTRTCSTGSGGPSG